MRMSRVVLACAVLGTHTLAAQTSTGSTKDSASASRAHRHQGRIVGVFDAMSSAPIEGVEVTDIFTDASARTPPNGLIELSAFQSRHDSAAIRVRKIGYADTALIVMVGTADTVPLSLFLSKAAPTLPTMISEAERTHSNRALGMADFVDMMNDRSQKSTVFTPAELRKADGRQLENALFDKGVGLGRCKAKGFQLYIDGIKQTQIGIPAGMSSDQFEAAIFYLGAPPLAYNMTGGRGCGTLILWTRRNVDPLSPR